LRGPCARISRAQAPKFFSHVDVAEATTHAETPGSSIRQPKYLCARRRQSGSSVQAWR
jgi:hypothetical protein